MSAVVVESFADVAAWATRDPAGGSSTRMSISAGGPARLPGLTENTATITAEKGSEGHAVERTGPAVDLRPFSDLLLWVRSDRPGDATRLQPLFAEVRLGSAASPVEADGNAWRRLVPVVRAGVWQSVPLALADLPDAVRRAVTTLRVTCVEALVGWRLDLDAILAVDPELLADADRALLDRLDGTLSVDGAPVRAVLAPVADPAPVPPFLRISNYDVRPDRATSPTVEQRTDYTGTGFALRPPATVFQLDYAVEALAADRAGQARLLQHVLAQLTPTTRLVGAGRLVTVDWIDQPATAAPPVVAPPVDHPVVHLRLRAALPGTAPTTIARPPFNQVDVAVDLHA